MNGLPRALQFHLLTAVMAVLWPDLAPADNATAPHVHEGAVQEQPRVESNERCGPASSGDVLEGLQVETSDIKLFEGFFESVLHAKPVLKKDHPEKDMLRGYCYRNVLIVVRQDIRQPRPTGWIQVNFSEQNVVELQGELERALHESPLSKLEEPELSKIVRLKLKSDVKRGHRKVDRLEVAGPEGFMIGFDQYK